MTDIAESFGAGAWEFTPQVTDVFDEHVSASVPFYPMIQSIIAEVADWTLPNGGIFVDVGASTGTTADVIATRHPDRHLRAYLYDEVPEMLEKAVAKLADHANLRVERRVQNVSAQMSHPASDLVTAVFLLQFLGIDERRELLNQLHRRSKTTGVLLVAEKIRPEDPLWHEIGIDASHDFKAKAGLSDTAIRQKARALRGVLRPTSIGDLMEMITTSGWKRPETLFRWHQWVVVGAFAE
ncbi:methyltransferase [Gordonia phage Evaa]|nr:methyltransferase [Gordonia phage Evaa]